VSLCPTAAAARRRCFQIDFAVSSPLLATAQRALPAHRPRRWPTTRHRDRAATGSRSRYPGRIFGAVLIRWSTPQPSPISRRRHRNCCTQMVSVFLPFNLPPLRRGFLYRVLVLKSSAAFIAPHPIISSPIRQLGEVLFPRTKLAGDGKANVTSVTVEIIFGRSVWTSDGAVTRPEGVGAPPNVGRFRNRSAFREIGEPAT
jgi:hypothetical protein